MTTEILNAVLYYIFVFLAFLPWLSLLVGVGIWFFAYQSNNASKKHLSILIIVIALVAAYTTRLLPILVFSGLANNIGGGLFSANTFDDLLTIIQVFVMVIVMKFCEIQAYIFVYQKMITEGEKKSSSRKIREFLLAGVGVTTLAYLILEMAKNLI